MDSTDFLTISSYMAEPLCVAYGFFRYELLLDDKISKVALRALAAAASVAALVLYPIPIILTVTALGLGSKIFRAIGFALQENGYSHIHGSYPEKSLDGKAKIMTWNLCGIGGGMHYDHGGVLHWRDRLDGIVQEILREDPDVLILQEIYDTSFANALVERLGPRFAHFFTHLGANVWGSVGGGFVATKCAYDQFSNTSFHTNDWTLNRTFTVLDILDEPRGDCAARIIGTHLTHNDREKRALELQQISNTLSVLPPTLLVGDLNIERDTEEGRQLDDYMIHGYMGQEPTCTNKLVERWTGESKPEEIIDYISICKQKSWGELTETHLVGTFETTETALSDHKAVVSTLNYQ
jgi:endonuclease/exonuclease/phosphatase family metal-dependent hydrolase